MKLKFILGLVLVALIAVILYQNKQVVIYRVFFWQISVSQIILVPLILLVGFVLGFLVAKITKKRQPKA